MRTLPPAFLATLPAGSPSNAKGGTAAAAAAAAARRGDWRGEAGCAGGGAKAAFLGAFCLPAPSSRAWLGLGLGLGLGNGYLTLTLTLALTLALTQP